ncbi:sphingolipid homeostasis protein orm1 [Cystobasidiomycetes sp. EMM_F5]
MATLSPPFHSVSTAPSIAISSAAASTSSPTSSPTLRTRARTTTSYGGSASMAGGSPMLRVHTGDLSPPPAFMRSKSSSVVSGSSTAGTGSLSELASGKSAASTSSSSKRGRSSSIISMQEIKENYDDDLDRSALSNLNADWVNAKGAWMIHVVLIVLGKILVDSIPSIEQDTSWTIVLQTYLIATYTMFHFVEGVPFESNNGVYDRLTMWEQIDEGAQYTPAKKVLTSLPIILHPALFSLNIISLVFFALIPKLPFLHRQRLTFGPPAMTGSERSSGANTPVETGMGRATLSTVVE